MNAQLLEIANKIGISNSSDLEAFELIAKHVVAECAKVCDELTFTSKGPSDQARYQRTLCSISIKENFGLVGKGPITAKNIK